MLEGCTDWRGEDGRVDDLLGPEAAAAAAKSWRIRLISSRNIFVSFLGKEGAVRDVDVWSQIARVRGSWCG